MQIPASSRFVQLTSRIAAWLDRAQVSGQLVLSATAVAVGLGTGFGAIVFIWMLGQVSAVRDLLRHWLGSAPGLIVAMALAGFAVGWIIERFAREAKGHGVPEVMEAMVLRGGRIRPRVSLAKVIASSLTIGAVKGRSSKWARHSAQRLARCCAFPTNVFVPWWPVVPRPVLPQSSMRRLPARSLHWKSFWAASRHTTLRRW
jgi:hypothetical protein